MKSIKLSNEAVSPVVGVMLMLVVTIIIESAKAKIEEMGGQALTA